MSFGVLEAKIEMQGTWVSFAVVGKHRPMPVLPWATSASGPCVRLAQVAWEGKACFVIHLPCTAQPLIGHAVPAGSSLRWVESQAR